MVAIKDMEMPKSCADCERGSICGYGLGYGRASDCPLVEIITCENCDNWDKRHYRGNTCYCEMRMIHTEPNEFCNEAMRKVEDETD